VRTNSDCTVYNKYINAATRTEQWQRTQIAGVAWENRKAANVLASGGNIQVDQATVYIPFARGTNYLAPRAWQALVSKTGKWTLQEGDVIVRGLVTDEISSLFTITALEKKYDDVLTISSVDFMDMGSTSMQHWQVGLK
jgi:hypothetical protein